MIALFFSWTNHTFLHRRSLGILHFDESQLYLVLIYPFLGIGGFNLSLLGLLNNAKITQGAV